MKRESVGTKNIVTLRLEKSMIRLAFMSPILTLLYGFGVLNGQLAGSSEFSFPVYIIIVMVGILLGCVQTFAKASRARLKVISVVSYHIMFALALIYILGIENPLVITWLLLIIATNTYFGKRWATVSFMALIGTYLFVILLVETPTTTTFIRYMLTIASIGAISLVFSSLKTLEYTEQEKLASSEAKLTEQREALLTIINGTTQAIFTVSAGGIVRIYNAALLSLLDTNQSLSGRKIDDVLSLYDLHGEPFSLHGSMKKLSHFERDDVMLRFADGDEIRLHISVNKIQSAFSSHRRNDGEGYVCIARDVTKEKSLEEERDEFISVVSHELRTPVAITEGTISNAQFFLEQGTDPKQLIPALQEAHDQVILLANMINDLGTLSRAERGVGDDIEEIDVRELANELYKKYSASATQKNLTLNLDVGTKLGTVTTSRLYLEEMLQNLITNAIKYTATGSVTLHTSKSAQGVEFAVSDTGIGIGKTDLKHIFEKFYRSEDYRTRETSGTGLGLYVVNKLMHKLGTKIEVKSRLNHGSTFSFILPNTAVKPKA